MHIICHYVAYFSYIILYCLYQLDLLDILNNLTPEVYHQMKPYIDYNYEVAKLDDLEDRSINVSNMLLTANAAAGPRASP